MAFSLPGGMMDCVLLADDDREMLMLNEMLLLDAGYGVFTAPDGAEARDFLRKTKEPISAMVLDWMMPGMTGIELLKWIKQQPSLQQIPVVMFTGRANAESIREGIDAGAFYYLVKPADPKVIRSIVAAAVFDFRLKQELLRKLQESENPFQFLQEGTFRCRTLAEGEKLAIYLANAASSPQYVLGISEIIINAIEHGNLGISYRDKSELVDRGKWVQEVERRLSLPENNTKHVQVTMKRDPNLMTILIEDQGPGFDFKQYLKMDEIRVFDNHGRGIAMTGTYITLKFLGSGNKVQLTIPS
jgi:DNA-binding response OmpR family regulator